MSTPVTDPANGQGPVGKADAAGARKRWRRAGLTGTSAVVQQGVVAITGLVATPLAVGYLGVERYGIWLTLSSLLAWLAITDVGLGGNALVNAVAEACGRGDRVWQREIVATAFWSLAGIGALLGLIVWAAFPGIPWRSVFNASEAVPQGELHTAVAICIAFFLLEFPARAASAVYYGSQRGYIANGWSILGSVASLGALFLVTRTNGSLPEVIFALWGVRVLVAYLASAILYGWQQPWLLPAPWVATRRAFRRLASLGVRYVVAQFGGFAMFQSHPIIIAQFLGPTAVAVFGVAYRVATFPAMIVGVLLSGLMPAYGEARVRRDTKWIQRTFRLSAILGALVSLGAATSVVVLLRPVVQAWVGPKLVPSVGLTWALGSYVLLSGFVGPASVMLYGVERVGKQALIAVANGLLVILLGALFTPQGGLTGMAMAMACALALTNLPGQFLEARHVLCGFSPKAVRPSDGGA